MGAFSGKAFGLEIVGLVKDHLAKTLAPLTDRLSALEKRVDTAPTAKDGLGVAGGLVDQDGHLVLTLTDGTTRDVGAVVKAEAERTTDGLDRLEDRLKAAEARLEAMSAVRDAIGLASALIDRDGHLVLTLSDGSTRDVGVVVKRELKRPTEDLDRLEERLKAAEVRLESVSTAKDAVGLTGALIDRDGNLVLTLSDGSTRELGVVVGKDADPALPGAPGLGFEDMTEELADDGRTIIRRYSRGDLVKEFRHSLAVVLDRGVFKAEQEYEPGDGVTYGGSFWIAQEKTKARPDSGEGWRLAVKKGRDGKGAS